MKYKICGKRMGSNEKSKDTNPFFEVDVYLDKKKIRLRPDLDQIQKAINKAATAVLKCSLNLYNWD